VTIPSFLGFSSIGGLTPPSSRWCVRCLIPPQWMYTFPLPEGCPHPRLEVDVFLFFFFFLYSSSFRSACDPFPSCCPALTCASIFAELVPGRKKSSDGTKCSCTDISRSPYWLPPIRSFSRSSDLFFFLSMRFFLF